MKTTTAIPRILTLPLCVLLFVLGVGVTPATLKSAQPSSPYLDPSQPIDVRVKDLVSRMTLEEKVAQVKSAWAERLPLLGGMLDDPAKMDTHFGNGIGIVNMDFEANVGQTVQWRNGLQNYLRTKTRLGIPAIFDDEAHHGLLLSDSDCFPDSIAQACSWNPSLLESIYTYIADQARSRGTTLVLAPVVDVARDPRWGRTGETYGEDPYLCGILGSAVVRGFQGSSDGSIAPNHVGATLKHFTGHGQSEGGINQGPSDYGPRILREAHMEPFRLIIQNARPAAIMAAYVEIDGIPAHANPWLLKDVLRDEWHYDGIVVSDFLGIDQLWRKHHVEPDQEHAAARAFNAGVTVDLPYGINYAHLPELIKENAVQMADLDAAVARVLTLKFKLGLFDEGPIDLAKARTHAAREEGRALALRAAEESMVLLKNENGLLPLPFGGSTPCKKIALIGPCAATNYLGDYSSTPDKNVTLLDGLKAKVGDRAEILYARGCLLTKSPDPVDLDSPPPAAGVLLPTGAENRQLIEAAVKVAERADVVIAAVGESEAFSLESGRDENVFGDMSDLNLQSNQDDLVKALVATGKPVIVYLMHGRPLSINWIARNVPAIVDGWFCGEEAGTAFANILFGDVNPSGKITMSTPRSAGQLPIFYNHKPSARALDYVTERDQPLFPFGYGLSYTTFKYGDLRLSDSEIKSDGSTTAEIDVENTGKVKGAEIVQLYIHQQVSSATRPVKELKDFTRVELNPGEKKTVRFTLPASKLAYWNAAMKYGVEPGDFDIMVGASSVDVQSATLTVKE